MGKTLRKAAIPTVVCVILCVLVFYLLGTSGPLYNSFSWDASFLVMPLIVFLVLLLGHWLAKTLLTGFAGKAWSCILAGAAFAFVSFMLLGEAGRRPDIPVLYELSHIRGYAALLFVGITISRLAPLLEEETRLRRARPAATATGILLAGYATRNILLPFAQFWSPLDGIGMVIFIGTIVGGLASLATYGKTSRYFFVADLCDWVSRSELRNFAIGVLFGSYFIFARPEIVERFAYAPLIEWAVVCLVVWRAYWGARFRLQDQYATLLRYSSWEKHVQKLDRKVDRSFTFLSTIQEEFVEFGLRSSLIVYLVLVLDRNTWSQHQISEALLPLITYQDEAVPKFAFAWEQRRVKKRNQRNRKRVLEDLMSCIMQQPTASSKALEVKP